MEPIPTSHEKDGMELFVYSDILPEEADFINELLRTQPDEGQGHRYFTDVLVTYDHSGTLSIRVQSHESLRESAHIVIERLVQSVRNLKHISAA